MRKKTGMGSLLAVLMLGFSLAVSGCGLFGSDKPEEPAPKPEAVPMKPPEGATLQVTIVASPLVNPDLNGRPSPILVRIYQLTNDELFKQADFQALYERDREVLLDTAVGRHEMIMGPGGIRAITTSVKPEARFIAVMAAYRKIDEATWKISVPLLGKTDTVLRADIQRLKVELRAGE